MDSLPEPSQSLHDKRTLIANAMNHLIVHHNFTPQKAQEWLFCEAMAKKARLDQVAEAITNDKPITYRYSAPI